MIKPICVQAVAEVAVFGRYPEGYATEPNGLGYRKNSRREDAQAGKWRSHFNSVLPAMCLFVLCLMPVSCPAAEEPDANARLVEKIRHAIDVDADTVSRLEQMLEESEQAIASWKESENGKRLVELEAQMKKAAKNKDLGSLRAAVSESKPLNAEYRALVESTRNNILGVLTEKQQTRYQAWLLADYLLGLVEPLELSPKQKAAVQKQAAEKVTLDMALPGRYLKSEEAVEADVLDAKQKEAFQMIQSENKMRSLRVPKL